MKILIDYLPLWHILFLDKLFLTRSFLGSRRLTFGLNMVWSFSSQTCYGADLWREEWVHVQTISGQPLRKFYMVMEPRSEETDFCYLGFFVDAEKNASQKIFFARVCTFLRQLESKLTHGHWPLQDNWLFCWVRAERSAVVCPAVSSQCFVVEHITALNLQTGLWQVKDRSILLQWTGRLSSRPCKSNALGAS